MKEEEEKAWGIFARKIVEASQRELGSKRIGKNRNYGVATRTLQRSLSFNVVSSNGKVERIQLFATGAAEKYAPFVHWGVNGTEKSRGSMFSYRNKQPPASAVLKWMQAKPVRLRDESGQFIKQTPARLRSAAFLIARAIKRQGIEGVRYFSNGYEHAIQKHGPALAQAIGESRVRKLALRINSKQMNVK